MFTSWSRHTSHNTLPVSNLLTPPPPSKMNNFTLTDYEEYLTGVLTKRPGRVCFATTSSIFLADLTGLVGSDLSCFRTRFRI